MKKLYPNISKARRILNWTPKISLKKGLSKTIRYYKYYGKNSLFINCLNEKICINIYKYF